MDVKSYEIFLDFDDLDYKGHEKISVETEDLVELDLEGLKITSVRANGKEVEYEVRENKLVVKTGKFSGTLEVEFEGRVKDDLVGIYKAPYDSSYLITTQSESSHARKFIPCVDNPAYKAEFKLTVKVSKNLDVISNMPIESVREEGNKKIVEFAKTPKMSTYLLYLGIGKFEEYAVGSTPKVIVATVPGKISKAKMPAELAVKFIKFYEDYFGIKYVLPKVHLIAVPEFAFGAMENWGAITFRETALLADEKSSFRQIRRVAEVIAHELAHQWFGDLVTMKWWNDLWLNESFATFMSYKAVDSAFPQWDFWGQFISDETSGAMLKDSLHITHPIEVEVKSVSEIEQIFDDISYGKGASILRMIEAYIGKEDFRKGIAKYLEEFKFSNAEGKDLWNSLEKASGKPVSSIMPSWLTTDGYPVVKVEVEGKKIRLTQKRFIISGLEDRVYPVPLTIHVNGKVVSTLFDKGEMTIDAGDEVRSLKLNIDRTGFYRVYYSDLEVFWNSNPNHMERFGVIDDYFNFLLAGMIDYASYAKIVEKEMGERNYLPATEIAGQLFTLFTINPRKFGKLALEFHRSVIGNFSSSEDPLNKMTYGVLSENLVRMDEGYANKLSRDFNNLENVDPNLRDAVVEAYAIVNEDSGFDVLLSKYRQSKFDEDKLTYLKGLLSFKKNYLILNALSLALTNEIKKQDVLTAIRYSITYPEVRDSVWIWLKTNLQFVRRIYQGTGILGRTLSTIIPIIGVGREEEVEKFFKENKLPEAEKGILQGLEILKAFSRLARD
ncbi:MAG: M1 family metallopeptidase [Candidatus Aramenus sulfurataquae]|jgi:tricorn protease interacting factor F2/3|uniref:Aminopeptidase n=2 Tax=Candidatus Aramenus sulfurataquae TaxID=1326980 RepID=A0A0F2LTP9_9CREN|nr:M1 family metallopeptidase [Candidatus Aramenus sulfurataquae]